jgi:hypothetical protein
VRQPLGVRPPTVKWAIRVTYANGRQALLRHGRVIGRGPVATFHSKAKAEAEAAFLREGLDAGDVVTVFERSHGRSDQATGEPR